MADHEKSTSRSVLEKLVPSLWVITSHLLSNSPRSAAFSISHKSAKMVLYLLQQQLNAILLIRYPQCSGVTENIRASLESQV
ncbi:hypothetical protein TNCV_1755301 [Trichonephila clavipes]|nr:hypothetical protein TNCV_1755301 [Trichonephila clavipes]